MSEHVNREDIKKKTNLPIFRVKKKMFTNIDILTSMYIMIIMHQKLANYINYICFHN